MEPLPPKRSKLICLLEQTFRSNVSSDHDKLVRCLHLYYTNCDYSTANTNYHDQPCLYDNFTVALHTFHHPSRCCQTIISFVWFFWTYRCSCCRNNLTTNRSQQLTSVSTSSSAHVPSYWIRREIIETTKWKQHPYCSIKMWRHSRIRPCTYCLKLCLVLCQN